MTKIAITKNREFCIAAAATERAYRTAASVRASETSEAWAQLDARETARNAELEAAIAYGTPSTRGEAQQQLALVTELAELIADGNAAPEHVCMARAAYGSALAFLTA